MSTTTKLSSTASRWTTLLLGCLLLLLRHEVRRLVLRLLLLELVHLP